MKLRFGNTLQNAPVILALLFAREGLAKIAESDVMNADGSVTYSYKVDNTGGSFDVAAWSLEFGLSNLDWTQDDVRSGGEVSLPNIHWIAGMGTPVNGQSAQDFIALDENGDVKRGDAQDGFSFTSRFLPGTITYLEFSADAEAITRTTIGPVTTVPERGLIESLAVAALAAFGLAIRNGNPRK